MKRSPSVLKREGRKRVIFERILIVCEGEKTEPNYLRELIHALGINPQSADCKIIDSAQDGAGSAPISIYKKAVSEFQLDGDYDRVYCVFDRDNHSTYEEACQSIRCKKLTKHASSGGESLVKFKAVTSDPRFEYWVLLHFEKSTKTFNQPKDVETRLKKYISNYKKDTKGLFDKIKGLLFGSHGAIKNSSNCRGQVEDGGAKTPITYMDDFVLELIDVAQKDQAALIAEWGESIKPYSPAKSLVKSGRKNKC